MSKKLLEGIGILQKHYQKRLDEVEIKTYRNRKGIYETLLFDSPFLKKDNQPRIFSHGKMTKDVIILTHGFTDSPHYVEAIGRRFFAEGLNVILTLLPGHGLQEIGSKMEEENLNRKWKREVDAAVEAAQFFGKRISLGGFSTGACLSVHKTIRHPKLITGGLFLFSAALDLGYIAHGSTYFPFAHTIARYTDGKLKSHGTNPYRYPYLNNSAGIEVVRLVDNTWKILKKKKLNQPVFVAHSVHDMRVSFAGIETFMLHHIKKGFTFLISEDIGHSQLVLKNPIQLDLTQKHGVRETPESNPKFDWMMDDAIRFFKEEVGDKKLS